MQTPQLTPTQTVGPFFANCLLREGALCNTLITPHTTGTRISIVGHVYDGDGLGVPDAMIEIWQANNYGRYNHPADTRDLPLEPHFTGYGRSGTDEDGAFVFATIKPDRVPSAGGLQAPHISVALFARGLLNHLFTRIYFADDPANADDPVLRLVPATRRATLLAQPDDAGAYTFNIVLQGAGETAFFNL